LRHCLPVLWLGVSRGRLSTQQLRCVSRLRIFTTTRCSYTAERPRLRLVSILLLKTGLQAVTTNVTAYPLSRSRKNFTIDQQDYDRRMAPEWQRPQSAEPVREMAPPPIPTSASQCDGMTDTEGDGAPGGESREGQMSTQQYLNYLDSTKSAQDYALEAIWDVESCPPAYIRNFGDKDRITYQSADPQTQAKIRSIVWHSTCRVHQLENPESQKTAYIQTMQILDPPPPPNWYPVHGSSVTSQQNSYAPINWWSDQSQNTGAGGNNPYVLPSVPSSQNLVPTPGHPLDSYTFNRDPARSDTANSSSMPPPALPGQFTGLASTPTCTTSPSHPVQASAFFTLLPSTSASHYQIPGSTGRNVPSLRSAQSQQPSDTSKPYQSPYERRI
jgi:hypothetical protein